jgi:hypothetical protein
MHILGINTSDNPKIVINSPEMSLDIVRHHAEVGLKNIIIFSCKNHLDRFCINGKQFIQTDLHHNFGKFLVQSLVMTYTQHIQKLATEDVWILRYSRSRVFTFLFLMPKILRNSSGKNNKSCRIFHNESNKIWFAFFSFFYDFLGNLQDSEKSFLLLEIHFCD